jgi:hypothetical protein
LSAQDLGSTWSDRPTQQAYDAIAARLKHLGTAETDTFVTDLWADPDRPDETHAVVSVRRGTTAARVQSLLPDWTALAWETDPDPDPRSRLREALLQGHLRARERLTGEQGIAPLPPDLRQPG